MRFQGCKFRSEQRCASHMSRFIEFNNSYKRGGLKKGLSSSVSSNTLATLLLASATTTQMSAAPRLSSVVMLDYTGQLRGMEVDFSMDVSTLRRQVRDVLHLIEVDLVLVAGGAGLIFISCVACDICPRSNQ